MKLSSAAYDLYYLLLVLKLKWNCRKLKEPGFPLVEMINFLHSDLWNGVNGVLSLKKNKLGSWCSDSVLKSYWKKAAVYNKQHQSNDARSVVVILDYRVYEQHRKCESGQNVLFVVDFTVKVLFSCSVRVDSKTAWGSWFCVTSYWCPALWQEEHWWQ